MPPISQSLAAHPYFQIFGDIHFPYRHPERSRGLFLALRSVSHRHWPGSNALVLRISAFAHPSFIGLQRRFLASLEMTIRERRMSHSHQSLVTKNLIKHFLRMDDTALYTGSTEEA